MADEGRAEVVGGVLPVFAAGDGVPLVLVHGGLLRDSMRPLAERLAGYRTIRYHRRGYGAATASPAGSIATEADDCTAVIEQVAGGPVHLVGWSHGGAVALETARRRPDIVVSLCLLEPALLDVPSAAGLVDAVGPGVAAWQEGRRADAVAHLQGVLWGPSWREMLESVTPGAAADAEPDLDAMLTGDLPAYGSWAPPSTGSLPVLYVGGDSWEPLGGEIRDRARGLAPGMQEVTITGAGHEFAATRAGEVADALRAFLPAPEPV